MLRADRYCVPTRLRYVTHLCQRSAFLLKFARSRRELGADAKHREVAKTGGA